MSKPDDNAPDDLEAVRKIIEALKPFNVNDQERIIRWTKEKLELPLSSSVHTQEKQEATPALSHPTSHKKHAPDIKTFVAEKNPTRDTHLAATVAYYYRFEAPEAERKEVISGDDLQEACRKAGRPRLNNPAKTLQNAHQTGLLDRAERGSFSINTVGENLVAMTLPGSAPPKTSLRKKVSKKAVSKRTKKVKGK